MKIMMDVGMMIQKNVGSTAFQGNASIQYFRFFNEKSHNYISE
jgi:hypothetical protein